MTPENLPVAVARIETKIDTLLEHREDHEARLRVLEAWKYRAVGFASAVGSAVGFLAPKLWAILPH